MMTDEPSGTDDVHSDSCRPDPARGHHADDQEAVLEERLQGLTPDHEATYVYTSGTTGPPKGVVQTHGNHLFMMESCSALTDLGEGDVNLLFLPLAHSFARLESFLALLHRLDHSLRGKHRRLGAEHA